MEALLQVVQYAGQQRRVARWEVLGQHLLKMVIFHSYVNVYQRVKQQTSLEDHLQIENDGTDWYSVSAIFSYELYGIFTNINFSQPSS